MNDEQKWNDISNDISNVAKKIKSRIDEEDLVDDLKDTFKNTSFIKHTKISPQRRKKNRSFSPTRIEIRLKSFAHTTRNLKTLIARGR